MAHFVGTFDAGNLKPAHAGHGEGYRQAALIDHSVGSVHTGTHICEIAPGGSLSPHCHAFEEGFYLLSGEAVFGLEGHVYHMVAGDFGAAKVGQVHSWFNPGSEPVRWLQMGAPQPKPAGTWADTYFKAGSTAPTEGGRLDPGDIGSHVLGHFDVGQVPPPGDPARNVPGAPAGVFLKWLVDEKLGAVHHRLLFIEYQPGVSLATHDHTFEESYFLLQGEVEAVLDGKSYRARPGDVLWTGVGCFHSFAQVGEVPVRWLETFAPQPPREDVFRFQGAWEDKARALAG
jgi:mannose-6-phosphate isomerase-like protein (cupin superfamily)